MYQSLQRFLNKEHPPIVISQKTTKEEFLLEHNKLSPLNLQATTSSLSRFRIEKISLFKSDDWSIDKLNGYFSTKVDSVVNIYEKEIAKSVLKEITLRYLLTLPNPSR